MGYRVIFGEYVIVGKQPDADSVRFRPDTPDLLDGLEGKPVRVVKDGTAQLRFQGVDAAELHYGGGRQPVAKYARNVLLYLMGFGRVRYQELTVRSVENRVTGAILTRGTEVYGRPISYLLRETDLKGLHDGQEIPEDADITPLLRQSLNYRMLEQGMLYYLAYDSMPKAHRELFRNAAAEARRDGLGVWVQDSTSEFTLESSSSIGPDGELIYPKLFRRCTDYLLARDQENFTGSFTEWLRVASPENDPVGVRGNMTMFADLVEESGGTVSLREDMLDLVFMERPSIPTVATAAVIISATASGASAEASMAVKASKRTEVIAHLVTGEDIEAALISTDDDPEPVVFKGSARDQKATVSTDDTGMLGWGLSLETQMAFAAWSLTLTKKGDKEGTPDKAGVTNQAGKAVSGGSKPF